MSNNEVAGRREAFLQFMRTIPKVCSPTICGTANYCTPVRKSNDTSDIQFNWSIEQIAVLNPCDFSTSENGSFFNDSELCASTERSNAEYFKKAVILASPEINDEERVANQLNFLSALSIERSSSLGFYSRTTPSKPSGELSGQSERMLFSESLTPLNISKQKPKKKLFDSDGVSISFEHQRASIMSMSTDDIHVSSRSFLQTSICSSGHLRPPIDLSPIVCIRSPESLEKRPLDKQTPGLPVICEESSNSCSQTVSLGSDESFAMEISNDSGCESNEAQRPDSQPFSSLFFTSTPSHY